MILAIVQARMGSSRLPGKVILDIAGKPMLWHVVNRVRHARLVDQIAVATSEKPSDDPIESFCIHERIDCFRGSENDVLDRYYQVAKQFEANVVVRITADCPLLDPEIIDKVVQVFEIGDYDYVSNTLDPSYPDGLDTEVFRLEVLEKAWREARLPSEREHVTPYIWKNPTLFSLGSVRNDSNLSNLRWTVDEPQDVDFVRRVYNYLGSKPSFGMKEIVALLREHPELKEINPGFKRSEGYDKSLREDSLLGKKELK